jgi:hypothetical protein
MGTRAMSRRSFSVVLFSVSGLVAANPRQTRAQVKPLLLTRRRDKNLPTTLGLDDCVLRKLFEARVAYPTLETSSATRSNCCSETSSKR